MEKKQTAVEWLVEQIKSDQNQKALSASEWMQVIEKAKKIEKEQIENAYWDGGQDVPMNGKNCDKYYKETYGN